MAAVVVPERGGIARMAGVTRLLRAVLYAQAFRPLCPVQVGRLDAGGGMASNQGTAGSVVDGSFNALLLAGESILAGGDRWPG